MPHDFEFRTIADQGALLRYLKRPDFTQPPLAIPEELLDRLFKTLGFLYGTAEATRLLPEVERLLRVHHAHKTPEILEAERLAVPEDRFTERDIVVITYGDLIQAPPRKPLEVLCDVANVFLGGMASTIHVLPFFPYSSDRGFSVIDFREVDPNIGSWEDIERAGAAFRLMFDGVVNHISSQSEWFQEYLNGNPEYADFFFSYDRPDAIPTEQLTEILRPRTSPLVSEVDTIDGPRWVWTTFSRDQVDLNFRNPEVLLRVLRVLLFYVEKGADLIRMDAATYLWKELGTSCAHLPQTHAVVRFLRVALDIAAPRVAILTETNVPHPDNISYFGDGYNEAHMVYNFALPPLVLHSFITGDCTSLARWAADLERPSLFTTYFNFLDSHDGIGLMGARGVLRDDQIEALVQRTKDHGGMVSYRSLPDGGLSPYEMNITWFDAVNDPNNGDEVPRKVDRFVASRSIALVLAGVPGVYLPSLTGSQIAPMDATELTEGRAVNRRNFSERSMIEACMDADSIAYQVAMRFRQLAEHRVAIPAFHPNARQKIMPTDGSVFAVFRRSLDGLSTVLALVNITDKSRAAWIDRSQMEVPEPLWRDRFTAREFRCSEHRLEVNLHPYQVLWLQPLPAAAD
ncbi:MAG: alpha-amylase family glycosyl hydrolase [Bryobacterales bacterium]|nr:alpha-amylase family glycosyl hydrolase [Bryobacterales bacterium]